MEILFPDKVSDPSYRICGDSVSLVKTLKGHMLKSDAIVDYYLEEIDTEEFPMINKVMDDIVINRSLRLFNHPAFDGSFFLTKESFKAVAKHYRRLSPQRRNELDNELAARFYLHKTGSTDFEYALSFTNYIYNKIYK